MSFHSGKPIFLTMFSEDSRVYTHFTSKTPATWCFRWRTLRHACKFPSQALRRWSTISKPFPIPPINTKSAENVQHYLTYLALKKLLDKARFHTIIADNNTSACTRLNLHVCILMFFEQSCRRYCISTQILHTKYSSKLVSGGSYSRFEEAVAIYSPNKRPLCFLEVFDLLLS